jgi:hypothetical protein
MWIRNLSNGRNWTTEHGNFAIISSFLHSDGSFLDSTQYTATYFDVFYGFRQQI